MFKKKNYKLFIGIIAGIIISSGIVYAASYVGTAKDLKYDNTVSGLYSSNVQDALDELWEMKDCPSGYGCLKTKNTLELGDYVYYEPIIDEYPTDTTKTGYSSSQTIYPSELKLWRVLFINDDGTVDIVSEDVSSTDVYFRGLVGYQNLVGYLNELASQYETEGITLSQNGSRHFGFNGQTEYIEDTSMFTETAPWTCSTGGSCDPAPVESQGGGDNLYERDYNQAQSVLKTAAAYEVNTSTLTSYWMASRYYYYSSSYRYWDGRIVNASGSTSNNFLYYYNSSQFIEHSYSYALRPVVTLSSELSYEGVGIKEAPMRIIKK